MFYAISLSLHLSLLLSLFLSLCALHSAGRQWDGRFSLAVCSPSLGWDRPWSVLLAGSVEGKVVKEEGREGERGLGGGRLEGWRRGLQLVMKSSLFILRSQSVSGRARGLRSSTAFSACKVCRVLLCAALPVRLSARLPQLRDTKRQGLRETVMRLSLVSAPQHYS